MYYTKLICDRYYSLKLMCNMPHKIDLQIILFSRGIKKRISFM